MAAAAGEAVEQVSSALLCADIQRPLIALPEVRAPAAIVSVLPAAATVATVRARLEQLLYPLWTERWRKAPARRRRPRPQRRGQRECVSAYRLIQRDRLAQHKLMPK